MLTNRSRRLLAFLFGAFIALQVSQAQADELSTTGVSGEADFRMYCASCHGDDGKGEGPKSFGLSVKTPDLTELTRKYGGVFPAERVAQVIDGRASLPGHLDREMPVWGVWFKEEAAAELGGAEGDEGSVKRRIDNLIAHISSLQE